MRDNIPCWDVCGGWHGKAGRYDGLYAPRTFMDFIFYASADNDDKFFYEADFYPGEENSYAGLPLYRMVKVDAENNPIPGEPVKGCDFEMRESTVGRLWEFQKAVNAIRYKMGARTAMFRSGQMDSMFRLAGDGGDPDALATRLANSFKMDGDSTVADLWAHATAALNAVHNFLEVAGRLFAALGNSGNDAAAAYGKLHTEQPPFPERFYNTLGNQLVEAAVVIDAFDRLTRGSGAGSAEPFHLLGPLEQLRIGLVNMEALGG